MCGWQMWWRQPFGCQIRVDSFLCVAFLSSYFSLLPSLPPPTPHTFFISFLPDCLMFVTWLWKLHWIKKKLIKKKKVGLNFTRWKEGLHFPGSRNSFWKHTWVTAWFGYKGVVSGRIGMASCNENNGSFGCQLVVSTGIWRQWWGYDMEDSE